MSVKERLAEKWDVQARAKGRKELGGWHLWGSSCEHLCGSSSSHLCGSPDPKIGVSPRSDTAEAQKLTPDTKRSNRKALMQLANIYSTKHMDSDKLTNIKLLNINQTTFGGYVRRGRLKGFCLCFHCVFCFFASFLMFIAHFACQYCSRGRLEEFCCHSRFPTEAWGRHVMRGSTKPQRNQPQSIIICQDQMKTLLNINDKTIRKVGPQIWASKSVSYKKRELGENWGPYNILLRAQPPSSHLPVPRRERKGEDGIGGRGVERPLRSGGVKQKMTALLGVRRCARLCLP